MADTRRRRQGRFVAVAFALVVTVAAAGCVEGYTGAELRSPQGRAETSAAEVRDASPVVAGLGADVLRALAASEADNVAVSPSALVVQLAMVAAGAGTSSLQSLDAVLGSSDLVTTTSGRTTLDGAVSVPAGRNGQQRSPQRRGPVEVDTAIALWIQRGPEVAAAFLDDLAIAHGTGLRQLDFRSDPEGARAAVNLWTASTTDDAVTEVAPGGSVTSATRLLSTAAQTIAAPWLVPFDSTAPAPFTTARGETVDVPTMSVVAPTGLRWGQGDGWQAVGLPYLGRQLMMVVVIADPQRPPLSTRLDGQLVADVIGGLAPRGLTVRLPRFAIDLETALSPVLRGLGAGVLFDLDLADLTPAAPTERLALTEVLQAVSLGVDEEGSGGRAATVSTPADRPPAATLEVAVNLPFLAMVIDVPTRTPLLMAEIVNPG